MCPELAEVLGSYRVTLSITMMKYLATLMNYLATLSITMMIYLATLSMTMMNYLATLSSSSFRSFILRSKSGSFLSMRSSRDPIILNNIDHKKNVIDRCCNSP